MSTQFADALKSILAVRGIAPTGYELSRELKRSGRSLHQRNLSNLLEGRTHPRRSTIALLCQALSVTEEERLLLESAASGELRQTTPRVISMIEALGGHDLINAGRDTEHITWRCLIGRTDEEDHNIEQRRTKTTPAGMRLVSIGPGEFGRAGIDLMNIPDMHFRLRAKRVKPQPELSIGTHIHVVELDPTAGQYRIIGQFGRGTEDCEISWMVDYRWAGIWRSLRRHGIAVGRFRWGRSNPQVLSVSVEFVAPYNDFADLNLRPFTDNGYLERKRVDDDLLVRWHLERPYVDEFRFELEQPSRLRS